MNAIELLENDHDKVEEIFEQLEATTEKDVKPRTELFAKLKQELDVHAHIEETIFYPALKQEAETRAITLEGFEEHHVMKILLSEIAALPPESEVWTAKFKVLKESVEHHVEEEEDDMFDKARDVFSEAQLEAFGTRMEAEKSRFKPQAAAAKP